MLEELACCLGVLVLEVPPLRQRLADLPTLVASFLERANEEGDRQVTQLDADVWELLRSHSWPANLRELFAVLQAARDRAGGERITAAELPLSLRLAQDQALLRPVERLLPLDTLMEQMERRLIEVALRRSGGHKGRAAELLAIWRTRLWRRIEALGIEAGEEPPE
jgi:DNA-binding NtrC family response regulator